MRSRLPRFAPVLAAAAAVALITASVASAAAPVALERTNQLDFASEIVSLLPGGETLVATQGSGVRFIDVSDPENPVPEEYSVPVHGSVTTAAPTPDGRYVLAAMRSGPIGNDWVGVIDVAERAMIHRIAVPDGPDSLAVAPGGDFAAVAIEADQSDNDGSVAVLDIRAADPRDWHAVNVPIPPDHPALAPDSGKPQPEFVDVNGADVAAVTLQENNAIAIVDLPTATLTRVFSLGNRTVTADDILGGAIGADMGDGSWIAFDDPIDAERWPDAVQWADDDRALVVVDEGENLGSSKQTGGRSWSIWRPDGELVKSVEDFESEHGARGLYHDDRSDNNGVTAEGIEVVTVGGRELALIATERAFTVSAYDISDIGNPRLIDIVETGEEPEGIVADPVERAVYTADEESDTITTLRLRDDLRELPANRPLIVSEDSTWANASGLGADGADKLLFTTGYGPPRVHQIRSLHLPRLPMRRVAEAPAGEELSQRYSDAARDPLRGWVWATGASSATGMSALTAWDGQGRVRRRIETVPWEGGSPLRAFRGLELSRDGRYAYLSQDRYVTRLDLDSGESTTIGVAREHLPENRFELNDLAWMPDGRLAWLLSRGDRALEARIEAVDVSLFDELGEMGTVPPDRIQLVRTLPRDEFTTSRGPTALAIFANGDIWTANDADHGGNVELLRTPRAAARTPRPLEPGSDLPSPTPSVDEVVSNGGYDRAAGAVDRDRAVLYHGTKAGIAAEQTGPLHLLDPRSGEPRDVELPAFARTAGSVLIHQVIADGAGGAFVAGEFDAVGGEPHANIVRLRPDGSVDPAFTLQADAAVRGLHLDGENLYVSGLFRNLNRAGESPLEVQGLARVALDSGAPDPSWTPNLTLSSSSSGYVNRIAQNGTTLYIAGPGLQEIDGEAASRIGAVSTADASRVPFAPGEIEGTVGDMVVYEGDLIVAARQPGLIRRFEPSGEPTPGFETGLCCSAGLDLEIVGDDLFATGGYFIGRTLDGAGEVLEEEPTGVGLIKLDPDTGLFDSAWRDVVSEGGGGTQTGRMAMIGGRLVIVGQVSPYSGSNANGFNSLDPETGEPLWVRAALSRSTARYVAPLGDSVLVSGPEDSVVGPMLPADMFNADVGSGEIDRGWTYGATNNRSWPPEMFESDGGEVYVWAQWEGRLDNDYTQQVPSLHRFETETGAIDRAFDVVLSGRVRDVALTEDRVYLAGTFTGVEGRIRGKIAAVDRDSGRLITEFVANANAAATATAIELAADGTVWVAGENLSAVNGTPVNGLAQLDPTTGAVLDPGPELRTSVGPGTVTELALHEPSGRLAVSGFFTEIGGTEATRLAFFEPETGHVQPASPAPTALPKGLSTGPQGVLAYGMNLTLPEDDRRYGLLAYDPVSGELNRNFLPAIEVSSWAGFAGDTVVALGAERSSSSVPLRYLVFEVSAPVSLAAPRVLGTPVEGEELRCDPGGWDGVPSRFAYAWLRDGAAIAGADAAAYTVSEADAGAQLSCRVTGVNSAGEATADSSAVTAQAGTWPKPDAPPAVSGSGAEGDVLSCAPGSWRNDPASFEYAWLRDGVKHATGDSYVPERLDDGAKLACRVTASNDAGSRSSTSEPLTAVAKPLNASAPALNGAPRVGELVSCLAGEWAGNPDYSYRWLLDGTAIAGATAAGYTPAPADAGRGLACEVTASRGPAEAAPIVSEPRTVAPAARRPARPGGNAAPPVGGQPGGSVRTPTAAPGMLRLVRTKRLVASRRGVVTIPLRCVGGKRCRGRVRLIAKLGGKRVVLGSGRFSIEGKSRRVRVKLNRTGRRLLRNRKAARVTVRLRNRGGRTVSRKLPLRRAARR